MNLNRVAYTLDLIADGYLKHSMPTHLMRPYRSYYICACLEFAYKDGVITSADYADANDWLTELGMIGAYSYNDLGLNGFYRLGSQDDDKQSVRWTWLKFAARLAREEAYQQRKENGR